MRRKKFGSPDTTARSPTTVSDGSRRSVVCRACAWLHTLVHCKKNKKREALPARTALREEGTPTSTWQYAHYLRFFVKKGDRAAVFSSLAVERGYLRSFPLPEDYTGATEQRAICGGSSKRIDSRCLSRTTIVLEYLGKQTCSTSSVLSTLP